jgi:trk system potassium uptake protein TrkH
MMAMGVAMLPCALLDYASGGQSWAVFGEVALLTVTFAAMIVLATANAKIERMSIKDAFFLTTATWVVLPLIGSLPFIVGAPEASFTDAYFEAVSGMTTTGSTMFVGLDDMPKGTLLWRGILQWLGGLGIVIVALVFLPIMRSGGMQFFQTEGFDTLGKVLPRTLDISKSLLAVYIGLTFSCTFAYMLFGMAPFEASVHAMTTLSTGGFSTTDQSFAAFSGPLEYVSSVFMILASMPFIRFIQLSRGNAAPLFYDVQARAYLRWLAYAVVLVFLYRMWTSSAPLEVNLRETTFNIVTLFSGTGYGSADVASWGPFPLLVILAVGLIGGCTASTGCSVKVFRWLIAIEAIKSFVKKATSPNSVVIPKLGGLRVNDDVMSSVIAFFTFFILSFGLLIVGLALSGLEFKTSVTAAWTAIANVGPAFGPEVGPTGAFDGFPTTAKWMLVFGMLIGRLEILSVFVLFTPAFWRS